MRASDPVAYSPQPRRIPADPPEARVTRTRSPRRRITLGNPYRPGASGDNWLPRSVRTPGCTPAANPRASFSVRRRKTGPVPGPTRKASRGYRSNPARSLRLPSRHGFDSTRRRNPTPFAPSRSAVHRAAFCKPKESGWGSPFGQIIVDPMAQRFLHQAFLFVLCDHDDRGCRG